MRVTGSILCCCLLWSAGPTAASPAAQSADPPAAGRRVAAAGDEIYLEPPAEEGVRLEAAFNGAALCEVTGPLEAPAEGRHWLAVASRDAAGNLSPIRWIEVLIDHQAPVAELATRPKAVVDEPGRTWLPPGATLIARATDDLAGVGSLEVEIDGVLRRGDGAELSIPLPAEGTVEVRAWAIDNVGNRSTEASGQLLIDGEPPSLELRASSPWQAGPEGGLDGALLAPHSRVGVQARDSGSGGVEWTARVDGEAVEYQALQGPWKPGPHTIEVTAVDRVGNERSVGPLRFTVDGEGPVISWRVTSPGVTGDDGESYYRSPVEVTVEASDAVAGVYSLNAGLDGRKYDPVEGPISVVGDTLHLHAFDRVANVTRIQARWKLDHEAPEVTVSSGEGPAIATGGRLEVDRGDEIEIRALDRGAGLARATYVLNRHVLPGHRRPQPLPARLRCEKPGRFTLEIEAEDRLGNTFSGRWQVDVRRSPGRPGGETP